MSEYNDADIGAATTDTQTVEEEPLSLFIVFPDDDENLSNENPLTLQFPRRQFRAKRESYAASAPLTSPILDRRPDSKSEPPSFFDLPSLLEISSPKSSKKTWSPLDEQTMNLLLLKNRRE
jgi:hypothetical protein